MTGISFQTRESRWEQATSTAGLDTTRGNEPIMIIKKCRILSVQGYEPPDPGMSSPSWRT